MNQPGGIVGLDLNSIYFHPNAKIEACAGLVLTPRQVFRGGVWMKVFSVAAIYACVGLVSSTGYGWAAGGATGTSRPYVAPAERAPTAEERAQEAARVEQERLRRVCRANRTRILGFLDSSVGCQLDSTQGESGSTPDKLHRYVSCTYTNGATLRRVYIPALEILSLDINSPAAVRTAVLNFMRSDFCADRANLAQENPEAMIQAPSVAPAR